LENCEFQAAVRRLFHLYHFNNQDQDSLSPDNNRVLEMDQYCVPVSNLAHNIDKNEIILVSEDDVENNECDTNFKMINSSLDNDTTHSKHSYNLFGESNDSKMHGSDQHNPKHNNFNVSRDPTVPHLLVLGTGCASPSPLRGSSGYALLLPTMVPRKINKGCYADDANKCDTFGSQSFLPHLALSAIIECGEGCLTTLTRHLPNCEATVNSMNTSNLNERLKEIRLIWISHAHLDHYGDLPFLIQAIHSAGGRKSSCSCQNDKARNKNKTLNEYHRSEAKSDSVQFSADELFVKLKQESWCTCILPPVVVAPPKVLNFLHVSLNSQNKEYEFRKGSKSSCNNDLQYLQDKSKMFFGITNKDFDHSPHVQYIREYIFDYTLLRKCSTTIKKGQDDVDNIALHHRLSPALDHYHPFELLRNIPVLHCPNSYALLLGLNVQSMCIPGYNDQPLNQPKPFFLCYSGDTRPSSKLVYMCHQIMHRRSRGERISLLIHESTFDDDTKGRMEALKKRHSTVSEALRIFRNMNAASCLLTHFSHRYSQFPPKCNPLREINATQGFVKVYERFSPQSNARYQEAVGFAIDGLLLPLNHHVTSFVLPLINFCSTQILGELNKDNIE